MASACESPQRMKSGFPGLEEPSQHGLPFRTRSREAALEHEGSSPSSSVLPAAYCATWPENLHGRPCPATPTPAAIATQLAITVACRKSARREVPTIRFRNGCSTKFQDTAA